MSKESIYGLDLTKPILENIQQIRNDLIRARGQIDDLVQEFPVHQNELDSMDGFLTVGVSQLYHAMKDIQAREIKVLDKKYGESLSFRSRGIGLDIPPGCFVCGTKVRSKAAAEIGNEYLNNIAAFVKSKSEGEEIVSWFDCGAFLDYREYEPNWIQVKIGACDTHKANLAKLHKLTAMHGVIRQCMINQAREL